ncbi:MAG: LegC family aminotransferase [bacterium]
MNIQYEPGAPATPGRIALAEPVMTGNELAYIQECLETNWVSSAGPFVDRFEHMVADYVGVRYAVAMVNGTSALHIALLVAGVEPDDEVLVSTLTFIAPANAIRYANAWPVFIDCEPDYWQMDPARVAHFLEQECTWDGDVVRNRRTGRRVKALLPVHILGHPCAMDALGALAKRFNLAIIEDATESLGARYEGRMTGHLGDAACFSFNGNKIITTGGGGMFVTDDEVWARRARYLSTQAKDDPVEYIHHAVGYNYRLTNIQAAMGCAQMEQLDRYVAAKRRIAAEYTFGFTDVPGITCMQAAPWAESTYWLFTVLVDPAITGIDRRVLLERLAGDGIQTRPLWQCLHQSPAYHPAQASLNGTAERLQAMGLSLPCSVNLPTAQVQYVVARIKYHFVH